MCEPVGKNEWLKVFMVLLKEETCNALLTSKLRNGWTKRGLMLLNQQSNLDWLKQEFPKLAEEETFEYTDSEENDNELSDILPENILELFESDSEELDFEGFHWCVCADVIY